MIFIKTLISDGVYSIRSFDDAGIETTSQHSFISKIYSRDLDGQFTFLLETEEKVLNINPSYFDNVDELFVTVYVDTLLYKTFLKTKVVKDTIVHSYTVLYKSQTPLVESSTPFLDRFTYYMPRWSTAYKNDISNFSKITYPLFSNIEKCFFKTSEISSRSLLNKDTIKIKKNYKQSVGKILDKDGNEKKFTYNIQNSPITRVSLDSIFLKTSDLISVAVVDFLNPIGFKKTSSTIFITSPLNSTVTIRGLTTNNVVVEEIFTFNTLVTKQSKYSYKKLFSFESDSSETILSNYLNCATTHIVEKAEALPTFIDKDKNQQYPQLTLDENRLSVKFLRDGLFETDEHFYEFQTELDAVFITDTQDAVCLASDGNLSTSLLRKNIQVNMPLHVSNNNNDYVFVESVSKEDVSFSVKTRDILDQLESNVIQVEITTNKGVYYIDSTTEQFTEDKASYILDGINSLDFSIALTSDIDFVSVVVYANSKAYQASHRIDKLTVKNHMTNIQNLYYIGNGLVVKKDDLYYKLNLLKDYYEIAEDGSILMYEDDLEVYSLKGVKLDG